MSSGEGAEWDAPLLKSQASIAEAAGFYGALKDAEKARRFHVISRIGNEIFCAIFPRIEFGASLVHSGGCNSK
jgi:hypothetical protein